MGNEVRCPKCHVECRYVTGPLITNIDDKDEIDSLRAEIERLDAELAAKNPAVEAARAWRKGTRSDTGSNCREYKSVSPLAIAVDTLDKWEKAQGGGAG